jgi:hypothetical protein
MQRLLCCHDCCLQAKEKVRAKGWTNVHVVEGDACEFRVPEGEAQLVTFSYSLSSKSRVGRGPVGVVVGRQWRGEEVAAVDFRGGAVLVVFDGGAREAHAPVASSSWIGLVVSWPTSRWTGCFCHSWNTRNDDDGREAARQQV